MSTAATDWDPEAYARFRGLRLRPALDLLAQVGALPQGAVVDLGCGDGAVGPALAMRFAGRRIIGVDASAAMLAKAGGSYAQTVQADIAQWQPAEPIALIFSNAALHWLGDHDRLLPRLASLLVPQGVLAVQMPRQYHAPSHRLLREIAVGMFPDRFDAAFVPPVDEPVAYWHLLRRFGEVTVWETEYIQRLAPDGTGHPVRRFTESTAMRPFVDRLDRAEAAVLVAAYDRALALAYPLLTDGSAVFPFRRLFLHLKV